MTLRTLLTVPVVALLLGVAATAQRPANAPATGPGGTPPDTVFLEELTWAESAISPRRLDDRDHRHRGHRAEGPAHGRRRAQVRHDLRRRQDCAQPRPTLVAPVVTYVPEGSWDPPTGHMGKPGTITLARGSLRGPARARRPQPQGRRVYDRPLPGRVGRQPHRHAHRRREAEHAVAGSAKAIWVDDYYTKAHREQETFAAKFLGVPPAEVGNHANILDTSELLFVAPQHIRADRLTGNDYENNGVMASTRRSRRPRSAGSCCRSRSTTRWRKSSG